MSKAKVQKIMHTFYLRKKGKGTLCILTRIEGSSSYTYIHHIIRVVKKRKQRPLSVESTVRTYIREFGWSGHGSLSGHNSRSCIGWYQNGRSRPAHYPLLNPSAAIAGRSNYAQKCTHTHTRAQRSLSCVVLKKWSHSIVNSALCFRLMKAQPTSVSCNSCRSRYIQYVVRYMRAVIRCRCITSGTKKVALYLQRRAPAKPDQTAIYYRRRRIVVNLIINRRLRQPPPFPAV